MSDLVRARKKALLAWSIWSAVFVPTLIGLMMVMGGIYVVAIGPGLASWWGGLGLLALLAATVVFFGAAVYLPVGSGLEAWVIISHRRSARRSTKNASK